MCFGTRDNQFGKFRIPPGDGSVGAIKLVHLYGYVSCDNQNSIHWSHWGCAHHEDIKKKVSVAITTSGDHVLLPASQLDSHSPLSGPQFQGTTHNLQSLSCHFSAALVRWLPVKSYACGTVKISRMYSRKITEGASAGMSTVSSSKGPLTISSHS